MKNKLIIGTILNPKSDQECALIKNGAMSLRENEGKWVVDKLGALSDFNQEDFEVIDAKGKLIMPTFFDVHFHWVQDDVREMPKDQLLEWLDKYTFPSERKFEDKDYSKQKSEFFFKRLAATGTLGGAIYSSIHEHALRDAQEAVIGEFAIGNVQMTMNSPDFLTQTKEEAIELSNKLAKEYKERYALTPRFAIATDPETMKETGKVAKENGCFIQTHLSENQGEIDFVMEIYRNTPGFEDVKNYTEIYDRVGLLGPKTIMGHGIHLSDDELELLAKTDTAIAHCPTSNAPHDEDGLGSGLFDFHKTNKANVRWALASDIGGGPILSMLDVMRSFVDQNKRAGVKATYTQAFYRSTVAGAQIMQAEKRCGNFEEGKEANFQVLEAPQGEFDSAEKALELLIKKGEAKRISYDKFPEEVFYRGQKVYSSL